MLFIDYDGFVWCRYGRLKPCICGRQVVSDTSRVFWVVNSCSARAVERQRNVLSAAIVSRLFKYYVLNTLMVFARFTGDLASLEDFVAFA